MMYYVRLNAINYRNIAGQDTDMLKVTFLDHSGFLTEFEDAYFLFDYYKGDLPKFDSDKKMYVFASHSHYDHYRKDIFKLRKEFAEIVFILSSDILLEKNVAEGVDESEILQMNPGEQQAIGAAKIQTLRSTDEGVAFLVEYDGKTIYHAGDLNWWHWEGEPEEENAEMGRAYREEIDKIQGRQIDLAFVPVDPRLEKQYCWGLDYFMRHTDTKIVFPMHFWGDYKIFDQLAGEKCAQEYANKIVRIEKAGQIFEIE